MHLLKNSRHWIWTWIGNVLKCRWWNEVPRKKTSFVRQNYGYYIPWNWASVSHLFNQYIKSVSGKYLHFWKWYLMHNIRVELVQICLAVYKWTAQLFLLSKKIVKAWQSIDILLCKTETKWLMTWFCLAVWPCKWFNGRWEAGRMSPSSLSSQAVIPMSTQDGQQLKLPDY